MLQRGSSERALADRGLAAPVRLDEVTGSTNATAQEMAAGGHPSGRSSPPDIRPRAEAGRDARGRPSGGRADVLLRPRPSLEPDRSG